jgi:hypothetical protein
MNDYRILTQKQRRTTANLAVFQIAEPSADENFRGGRDVVRC